MILHYGWLVASTLLNAPEMGAKQAGEPEENKVHANIGSSHQEANETSVIFRCRRKPMPGLVDRNPNLIEKYNKNSKLMDLDISLTPGGAKIMVRAA